MHLKSLGIQNFRSLEDFKVCKLGRVNLIVGKNNSGKSSVLEALRIYAGTANPNLLEEIAASHDERYRLLESEWTSEPDELPYENFFTGRRFPEKSDIFIKIGEDHSEKNIIIRHDYIKTIEEETSENGEIVFRKRRVIIEKEKILNNEYDFDSQNLSIIKNNQIINSINIDNNSPRIRKTLFEQNESLPCSIIPTQFISMDDLASIWDDIQFSPHGDFVKDGLKIISDDFENIAFVNNDSDFPRPIRRSPNNIPTNRIAKVKLRGATKAAPLNSMGDGMLRVLQLLLKIYPAKGGFLLIDEFENGLHYSIQEKIWGYVFDLAEKLNIQVFATTHSWDCIESFSKVALKKKNIDGVLFRVGKSVRNSDNGKIIATVFDEEQLFNITQSDVEVR